MTTGKPWNENEIKTICSVYASMLLLEQKGRKFNKSLARRNTLPHLDGRSAGSYEMKMCNISAALNDMGWPWVKGYKPLKGYQHALKPAIVDACLLVGLEGVDDSDLAIVDTMHDYPEGAE